MSDQRFAELKNDLILRVCRGEKVERTPVWIMRQAGRYLPEFKEVRADVDFFTVCRNPELACKVTLQPIDRFPGLDAAIIFSDILVIPQAMGLEVQMIPGKGPHFPDPVREPSEMSRVKYPVDIKKELQYVFDAITLTRQRLEGRVPLIGFSGAPWTLLSYCIEGGGISGSGMNHAKLWLYKYKEESHRFLKMLTDTVVGYLIGQVDAGAQLLQVFDSWSGDLSPDLFDEYCLPYLVDIAKRVKEVHPTIPMICFAKGSNFGLTKLAQLSQYDVLGIDWTIEPKVAREFVAGTNKVLQGNMDPAVMFAGQEVIDREVERMINSFGTQRYIANLGHGMQPSMTIDSAANFISSVHNISTRLASEKVNKQE
ncbi:uroporphyrinogen decarboxylase [Heterostelium album PN500]|uniref:Uroporphyrinogen decarboxylase n=1 Tax=Heterostelium pallidum (strain ATCC 26659 / Pp 5 / PN500) TaxID=670386 RepID=D3BN73_HETP5|nr:uroporphyrinogen decarboxylase [Heterostelium album PN500]EFA76733.1 uroporphyrinogen decarboxylase [Heterostelium album PN500]|eukprot:XP_020428865.1 uroporphyrinogen decarboxylase [Heterostelium album PN500]